MLTKRDRTAFHKRVEEIQRRRAANIRYAMAHAGGWDELGLVVGKSGAFLRQMAGDNPQRQIGERLARQLEVELGLPLGWMDEKHAGVY